MQNQKWNYSIVVYQFFFLGTIILCLPIWFIVNAFYEKLIDQIKSNTLYIEFLSLWLLYISPSGINPFDDAYTYIILFSIILSIIVTGISRISKYYYGEFWCYCVCTCSYLVMCYHIINTLIVNFHKLLYKLVDTFLKFFPFFSFCYFQDKKNSNL